MSAAENSLSSNGPSSDVMGRIRERAGNNMRPGIIRFPGYFVRLTAYAAALLISVGAWYFFVDEKERSSAPDSAEEFSALLCFVMEDQLDMDNLEYMESSDRNTCDSLADQLLRMEGMAVDEFTEEDIFSLSEEPSPTALQSHSIYEIRPKICV
jgi:hypothetical protein